jgi:hypothetical protein
MNIEIVGNCWNCGKELQVNDYGRENNCLGCSRPTKVCLNCRWYDTSKSNACAEPMTEEVMEKDRPNFCNFFEPEMKSREGVHTKTDTDYLAAAEDLFKF